MVLTNDRVGFKNIKIMIHTNLYVENQALCKPIQENNACEPYSHLIKAR